jgi:hypothetical protein
MVVVATTTIFEIQWVPAADVTLHSFSHWKTMKPLTQMAITNQWVTLASCLESQEVKS